MTKYRIEYLCTYYDAVWMYKIGGINDYIDNPNYDYRCYNMNYSEWIYDSEDVFDNEEDARKVWNEHYTKSYIWNKTEFDPDLDEPEIGITMYTLVKIEDDKEDDNETVLEYSKIIVTPEDIQKMYPDFDFDNAEC